MGVNDTFLSPTDEMKLSVVPHDPLEDKRYVVNRRGQDYRYGPEDSPLVEGNMASQVGLATRLVHTKK